VVKFHELIVRPNLPELEMRRAREVWQQSGWTFTAKILGPHFEMLAREWTAWYGRDEGLHDIGAVGSTVVACRLHGHHEVDVAAISRQSRPRTKSAQVTVIGEAKATSSERKLADLRRLEHIRDLLVANGRAAPDLQLVVFSRHGFSSDLHAAGADGSVRLVDLGELYGQATRSNP
jgi:hypothetical protein